MPIDKPTRREFLGAVAGGALVVSGQTDAGTWARRIGLQVYTVRDRLSDDFEGALAEIGALGYREVELFGSLGDRTPEAVRAILDRSGLSAVSTHIAISAGPDLERQLEAWAIIGHRYTAVQTPPAASGPGRGNASDRWLRQAEALNEVGRAGEDYGVQALVHNHTEEFEPLAGADENGYEILLRETDPELVAMELDVGWAKIAGQDVLAMFEADPGRYRLWHVKDVTGLDGDSTRFVPVGEGEIDYRAVFEKASPAGLEHYFIEQDNAPDADSMTAIETSARNLRRILG